MLPGLKVRPKGPVEDVLRDIDERGARRGFVDREPATSMGAPFRRKPGRKPSPRTQQLHPRVLPSTGEAFLDAAKVRRLSQGQMFEVIWAYWLNREGGQEND